MSRNAKSAIPAVLSRVHLHQAGQAAEIEAIVLEGDDAGRLTLAANPAGGQGWAVFGPVPRRSTEPVSISWSHRPPADPNAREPKAGDEIIYFSSRNDFQDPLMDSEGAIVEHVAADGTISIQISSRSFYLAKAGRVIDDLVLGSRTAGARFVPAREASVCRGVSPRCWEYASDVPVGPLVDPGKARGHAGAMLMRSVEEQLLMDEHASASASKLEADAASAAAAKAEMLRGGDASRGYFNIGR